MCEYGAFFYRLSVWKECLKKDIRDLRGDHRFARERSRENLPCLWKQEAKLLVRELNGVDMTLQRNKVKNLSLARERIDGIVIRPGEEFSLWKLVGKTTKSKGYLEGLEIHGGTLESGIGGGLCQMANMIHWLVLHSPLAVTELHHHSDALFPDSNRKSPFGTGTSIFYKALDYRFQNTTGHPVQIRVWLDDTYLYGEMRSEVPLAYDYQLTEEDHHYTKDEHGVFFRNSKVYRLILDKQTGQEIKKELLLDNHSKVMYDYDLIPAEEIRVG